MGVLNRTMTALLLCAAVPSVSHGQISPGPLAQAHADLEGIKKCLSCHKLGSGPSEEKCLDCHREIATSLDKEHGYHYRKVSIEENSCFACHREHAGRDFQLVHWDGGMNNFDHLETGHRLAGAHAKIRCRDCHKPDFVSAEIKSLESVAPSRTFLGLNKACLGCHSDVHRNQLGSDCMACHEQDVWSPAPHFDHNNTRYPLAGAHRVLSCERCHSRIDPGGADGGASYTRYSGLTFLNCVPCHSDVHAGRFGTSCADCHTTAGWRRGATARFDHTITAFPLRGKHAAVTCEGCHAGQARMTKLPFDTCQRCHNDEHRGQLAAGGERDCAPCHDESGFVPAYYTTADHDRTRFSLAGAHLAQPCIACHSLITDEQGATYRQFVFADVTCTTCHMDVHAGQFTDSKPVKTCGACHVVTTWHDLAFSHNHDSSYPLEGAHVSVPCNGCHTSTTRDGVRFVRYRPLDPSCQTCHAPGTAGTGQKGDGRS